MEKKKGTWIDSSYDGSFSLLSQHTTDEIRYMVWIVKDKKAIDDLIKTLREAKKIIEKEAKKK